MAEKILILGAGFGGLAASSKLRESLDPSVEITLIDKSDSFSIGFTKFDVMFGRKPAERIKNYYRDLALEGVDFVQDEITEIDVENKSVKTKLAEYGYDYLIVALGADLAPEATPGFAENGYHFYSIAGAERIRPVIEEFKSGTVLISIFAKPYKCPPAPYEAALQLHDLFVRKGIRDNIQIKMAIPGPMPLPVAKEASAQIEALLAERDITLHKLTSVTALDPTKQQALVEGQDPIDYDLFIGIPIHKAPQVVRDSALGADGWIAVNQDTLETSFENVYAVGDVTKVPVGKFAVPKAGAFAEDGAQAATTDIINKIKGENAPVKYNGIGTCYLELGDQRVGEIHANFLGGPEPQVTLSNPSHEYRENKLNFEKQRISQWFR